MIYYFLTLQTYGCKIHEIPLVSSNWTIYGSYCSGCRNRDSWMGVDWTVTVASQVCIQVFYSLQCNWSDLLFQLWDLTKFVNWYLFCNHPVEQLGLQWMQADLVNIFSVISQEMEYIRPKWWIVDSKMICILDKEPVLNITGNEL